MTTDTKSLRALLDAYNGSLTSLDAMRTLTPLVDALHNAAPDLLDAYDERNALREELAAVLSDWNDLVAASGSKTNGGAIGHVAALVRERDALKLEIARLREWLELLLEDCQRSNDACYGTLSASHVHGICDEALTGATK